MNEIVQKNIEWVGEVIDELKWIKLYSPEEIKLIQKLWNLFEYKINGFSKTPKDIEDYIDFERVIIREIRRRRENLKISERKSNIEFKILRHMKKLYDMQLQRYPDDFQKNLDFFEFCKKSNFVGHIETIIQNMIRKCSDNPDAFKVAAAWYAYDQANTDLNKALTVLNKGLTIHKDSELLFTYAIKLELSGIKPKNVSSQDDSLEKRVCERLKTYINLIAESINKSDYLIKLLDLVTEHKCTEEVQSHIVDKLLLKHSDKASVWHALAQRERNFHHHGRENENLEGETNITLCVAKYEEGLERVQPSEKAELWSFYLDFLLDKKHKIADLPNTLKINLLKNAFRQAAEKRHLAEEYYLVWLEHVSDKEAPAVLHAGTEAYPRSEKLWNLKLRYATLTEKNVEVDEVFRQGTENLKELGLQLWHMYLRYYSLLDRIDKIEEIYKAAVQQPARIAQALKPKYIEWLMITKGIQRARAAYDKIAEERPHCKELHLAMCKMESMELEPDFVAWEKVHAKACAQFGADDVDVWINCIYFYFRFYLTNNANERIQTIRNRAMATLTPLMHDEFMVKFAKAVSDE